MLTKSAHQIVCTTDVQTTVALTFENIDPMHKTVERCGVLCECTFLTDISAKVGPAHLPSRVAAREWRRHQPNFGKNQKAPAILTAYARCFHLRSLLLRRKNIFCFKPFLSITPPRVNLDTLNFQSSFVDKCV